MPQKLTIWWHLQDWGCSDDEVGTGNQNGIRNALQTMYDALNQGQQKQIVKEEAVKVLFDRYGVDYVEE